MTNLIKTVNDDTLLFPGEIQNFFRSLISGLNENLYLVGGAVRDFINSKPINDYDILVKTSPKNFLTKAQKICGGTYFCLDEELQIFRLIPSKNFNSKLKNKVHFDFAMFCGKTIEEDLNKRDFTINAIATDIKVFLNKPANISNFDPKLYIDHCNGIGDIHNKILKTVTKNSFRDDPLRLLRLFRFKAQFNFSIDKETLFQAKKDSHLICQAASERRTEEIFKIFETPNSEEIFNEMNNTFLLSRIFDETPETEIMKSITFSNKTYDSIISELMQIFKSSFPDLNNLLENNALSPSRNFASIIKFLKLSQKFGFPIVPEKRNNFIMNNKELQTLKKASIFSNIYRADSYDSKMIKCLNSWSNNHIHIILLTSFLISENKDMDFLNVFKKIYSKYIIFKKSKSLIRGKDLKKLGINSGPKMGEILNKIWLVCVNKEISEKQLVEQLIPKFITNSTT